MTVRIEARDSEVKVVRYFGFLLVDPQHASQGVVGEVRGVGIVGTPMGLSIGYTQQRWVAIGPECRVVLWTEGVLPIDEATKRALIDISGLCLAEPGLSASTKVQLRADEVPNSQEKTR